MKQDFLVRYYPLLLVEIETMHRPGLRPEDVALRGR